MARLRTLPLSPGSFFVCMDSMDWMEKEDAWMQSGEATVQPGYNIMRLLSLTTANRHLITDNR